MVEYKDLFRQYIKDSGLSLSQIADKLSEYGIGVGKAYLSQLQNGKKAPASDELNRAVAEITGKDANPLLAAAFVAKAPPELRETAERLFRLKTLREDYDEAKQNVDQASERVRAAEERIAIARRKLELLKEKGIIPLEVPVLHNIPGNGDIEVSSPIGWEIIGVSENLTPWQMVILQQTDDSLIGSRILPGDKVLIRIQSSVEDGEIAAVNVDGGQAILRRVKHMEGNLLLLADNSKYEPLLVPADRVKIRGVVRRVIIDLLS